MKITDAFLGEHAVFYAQFEYIEQSLIDYDLTAVQSVACMLVAGLATHAHMEDDLLFDAVRDAVGEEPMPFRIMREEHEAIETALEEVFAAATAEQAAATLRHAVDLAREHFHKEEHVAFGLAETLLSPERLHHLGDLWAEQRRVVVMR